MRDHTVNLKQDNMLCHRCLMNVVKALSHIEGIKELKVSLEEKNIKITYDNGKFTEQMVQDIVNEAIIRGKVNKHVFDL